MIAQVPHTMRELDSRSADGIQVRLLWSAGNDRVLVTVADAKSGDDFTIEVRAGDDALDVFRHPYAYAACREPAQLQAA